MRRFTFLFLLLSILGLSGPSVFASSSDCNAKASEYQHSESYENFYERSARKNCQKNWTILVYMAADNDLFPYALWDLYEMEAAFQSSNSAGSTAKTDLIVQVDGPQKNDLRRLHMFQSDTPYATKSKRDFERASLDDVQSPIVEKLRENGRESEQERLEDFLLWGAEKYPSKNFFVIVWGHGQGWKSFPVKRKASSRYLKEKCLPANPETETPADERFGGIAFRKSSNSWLDIPSLRDALETFRRNIGKPVDVYASDACLMQMLEVSYEISPSARFIVGSTQVQSFLGLPYRRILYELNTGHFNGMKRSARGSIDASDEPYLLAKMIPQLMKQSLDPRRGSQGRSDKTSQKFLTSSALTSEEYKRFLLPEMTKLSTSLKNYLQEDPLRSMDILFVLQSVPSFEGSAQDFGAFLGMLELLLQEEAKKMGTISSAAAQLRKSVQNTKTALDRSILAYAYGSAYPYDEFSRNVGFIPRAVSLWLPVSVEEYQKRRKEFVSSKLYKSTRWQEWLDVLFPN